MSVKIIYFVHGTTVDNESGISSGWKDAELSELGMQQGHKLREQTADQQFDAVFCSDLKRATDTSHIAFDNRAPVFPDARLRECNYGKLNGSLSSIVEPMQEEECIYNKFPEGESYEDIEFLKNNYQGKSVAIVSHKAPQLALEVLLNGKTWKEALAQDWRKTKAWQPGWEYNIK